LLTSFKCSSIDEASTKVLDEISQFEDDPEIRQYKNLILLDTKDNVEIRVENPYFDGSMVEKKEKVTKADLAEAAQLDMMQTVIETYKQFVPQLMQTLIVATSDALKESFKKLVSGESEQPSVKDYAELIKSIVMLAQNKDAVKGLLKEAAGELKDVVKEGGEVGNKVE